MTSKPQRVTPDQRRETEKRQQIANQIEHIRQDAIDAVAMARAGATLSAVQNLHAALIRLCDLLEAQL